MARAAVRRTRCLPLALRASAARSIGVASYDNSQRSFTVNGTPYGYNAATGAPLPPDVWQLADGEDRHTNDR